jgi:5'-nucleotidase
VEGTPADSVILALGKLVKDEIDMVVAGINQGANLGDDVLISGTVGAALQGYLRGFPALAISADPPDSLFLGNAAKLAALLVEKIDSNSLPADIFLNVNLPPLPLTEIKGVKITHLASQSHTDTIDQRFDGKREYYWMVRQQINTNSDKHTDIWAIEQGNISITPLYADLLHKPSPSVPDSLCSGLLQELKKTGKADLS